MSHQALLTHFFSRLPPPTQTKRSPPRFSVRHPTSLPLELVVEALTYLSLEDLRSAAAVCRQFKAAAYRHAGLYIHRRISIPTRNERDIYERQLGTFRDVTRHAIQFDLRVGLSLLNWNSFNYWFRHEKFREEMHGFLDDVFLCIKEALPVLVCLSISMPQFFWTELVQYLCYPAPHLVEFDAYAEGAGSICPHRLPESMFAGAAPKLAKVELRGVFPGDMPIPAFASAKKVLLACRPSAPVIPLARHFPSLDVLTLDVNTDKAWDCAPFDSSGLSLRRLVINDDEGTGILSTLTTTPDDGTNVLCKTPFIEHCSPDPNWCHSFWDSVKDKLYLRILSSDLDELDTHVMTVHEGSHLFRILRFEGRDRSWSGLTFLSTRFTYIRLDNEYVAQFLWSFTDGMPSLRRLKIDFCAGSENPNVLCHPASRSARCPVLETVTLFAMDKPICITRNKLAQLGRALGQQERTPGTQAIVTLVGVAFWKERSDESLPLVFPTIKSRAFEGRGSREDSDAKIWEPYKHVVEDSL